jgi:phospholipase D1/2
MQLPSGGYVYRCALKNDGGGRRVVTHRLRKHQQPLDGVDTECDLAIEAAGRPEITEAIHSFPNRLLAEHLGVTREEVDRVIAAQGSIAGAVKTLERPGRTLKRLEVESHSDVTLSLAEMSDPEQAVGLDKLMALFSYGAEFHAVPRQVRAALPYIALATVLFVLWRFTSLRNVLRVDRQRG